MTVAAMAFAKKSGPAFNGPEYIAKSAAEKSEQIWASVIDNTKQASWYNVAQMGTIMTESMAPTFETEGDELGGGVVYGTRGKWIHTVGTVGQVEWVNKGGHPYTGIFEGANKGFIRTSLAKEPHKKSKVTAPGIGLKFVRDGVDSANLVSMYSVDGQKSWNFFLNDFTSHIPAAGWALKALAGKFATYTKYVQQSALADWATYS